MSIRNSLRNLAGVVGGMAVLCVGAWALLNSAVALANLTGTIQAQWAATLISFGLCLPLLVEVFDHPLGSAWKRFAEKWRIYPPQALPMQRHFEHHAGAACFQPDVPPPLAGG